MYASDIQCNLPTEHVQDLLGREPFRLVQMEMMDSKKKWICLLRSSTTRDPFVTLLISFCLYWLRFFIIYPHIWIS